MRKIVVGVAFLQLLAPLGCAWVSLSEKGRGVQVVSNNEVGDCERIGNTKATVLRKVWFVPRREKVVQRELVTLARNEGGKLGGNAVTPLGSERAGKREFAVYVCGD